MPMTTLLRCVVLTALCVGSSLGRDCERQDPCSCQFDDGSGAIDLTSLGNTDGTPRFEDVPCANDDNLYSYNPCGGFSEQQACMEAALCQLSSDKSQTQMLGAAKDTDFKYDTNSDRVVAGYIYHGISLGYAEVELICDESACEQPVFLPLGQSGGGGIYKMQLRSICACAGKCTASGPGTCSKSSGGSSGSLSVGSLIVIGVFGVLVLYFVGGVMYMKLGKKKSGSDVVPNKDMWVSIPQLVKGGCKFVFTKVTSRKSGYTSTS